MTPYLSAAAIKAGLAMTAFVSVAPDSYDHPLRLAPPFTQNRPMTKADSVRNLQDSLDRSAAEVSQAFNRICSKGRLRPETKSALEKDETFSVRFSAAYATLSGIAKGGFIKAAEAQTMPHTAGIVQDFAGQISEIFSADPDFNAGMQARVADPDASPAARMNAISAIMGVACKNQRAIETLVHSSVNRIDAATVVNEISDTVGINNRRMFFSLPAFEMPSFR